MRAELGDDAAGEPEIFGVAHHGLADRGDAHDGDPGAQAGIDQPRHVVHQARLMLAADEHLDADAGRVQTHRIVHIHRDLLIRKFIAQNARARRSHAAPSAFWHCAGITERNMPRVQNKASQDGNSGTIRKIDAFEAGGRTLEITVVDGEHHGAPGSGIEHARQPVLHSPIELMRTFQIEARRRLGLVGSVALAFLDRLQAWHCRRVAKFTPSILIGCRAPKRIYGAEAAVAGEHGRCAVLGGIIFTVPVEGIGALIGNGAPSGIAIKAGMAGRDGIWQPREPQSRRPIWQGRFSRAAL